MARINENFNKLPGSYLFSEIARRVAAYTAENPDRSLIRLGIGDVTRPLPAAVTAAMHKAVDEMATAQMAFVDLAHLRKEDIKGRVLSYYRQKSGSLIQVEIPVEAQGLLDDLAADTTPDSPYLFPFLDGMKTGEDAYKEYNAALAGFNRSLRTLSESIGINFQVTSYTIRHSFATTLKEQNVPIEMISELLGHKSIKTTQIYLKSFSLEKLSTVNKLCFESVYNYAPKVG